MSAKKKKKNVTRHLSATEKAATGILMSGLLIKKGKRSYLATARHCALTRDCFVYSSGDVRKIPILNMQVSVARESFTLTDCSEEHFTFRVVGKTTSDREKMVQQWTQRIIQARDALKVVMKGVLKQGKGRDIVLVNTWLTEGSIITAEPYRTGATVILLCTVTELLPVPLEPALIMHTSDGKALRLTLATEKHQQEWLSIIGEYIRRAKLNDEEVPDMPQDIEIEMQYSQLLSEMRAAVSTFYQKHAAHKVCLLGLF